MQISKLPVKIAVAISLFAPVANGEVVYHNDFSTRTSIVGVPSDRWLEVKYETGLLANPGTYSGGSWTYDAFGGSDLQDNWIKGRNTCEANAYIVEDGGNAEVVVCHDGARKHGIFKQRIGNVFTNGVVTAQCDFLAPTDWTGYNPLAVRFFLGDETFFSPDTSGDDYVNYVVCGAGVNVVEGAYGFVNYNAYNEMTANRGVWYRVVVAADIDAKTCRVSFYDLGSAHPTIETPTPSSPVLEMVDRDTQTSQDIKFRSVTQGVTLSGISAVGFGAWGVSGNAGSASRATMARFDNIRIAHDGIECYVNDFSSRRSRGLVAGSTSAVYAPDGLATNRVSYANDIQLVANAVSTDDPQPVGEDGWRRLNKDSYHSLATASQSGNQSGRMSTHTSGFSIAAHPIGQVFTSGKVRISADLYAEAMDDGSNYGNVHVDLGSDALYGGGHSDYANGRFAEAGVHGAAVNVDGVSKRIVRFVANGAGVKPGDSVNPAQWLRYVIEADLDAGTYDFAIYKPQASSGNHPALNDPDGQLLYFTNGIPKAVAAVDSISCFMLRSYYAKTWFDNIKVWHGRTGSSDRTLVYSNSFSSRSVFSEESALVGTMREGPCGMDGWTRLGRSEGEIRLVGGDNSAIGFGTVGPGEDVWVAHDIGKPVRAGKATVRFDVLAPGGDGCGYVWIGGDQLLGGNLSGGAYGFEKWAVAGAGISNGVFAAWRGDGAGGGALATSGAATSGHWYRFVVKADLSGGTSDVEIFDMGKSQPEAATGMPSRTPVASFANVPFRRSIGSGVNVSCVAVEAGGVAETNPILQSRLLIDNVSVEHRDSGLILILR